MSLLMVMRDLPTHELFTVCWIVLVLVLHPLDLCYGITHEMHPTQVYPRFGIVRRGGRTMRNASLCVEGWSDRQPSRLRGPVHKTVLATSNCP